MSEGDLGVLGAGSWGTALAVQLARAGQAVHLWARSADVVETLVSERRNPAYLPGVEIPAALQPTNDLAALVGCRIVLVVVPSHGFRAVLRSFLAEVHRQRMPAPVLVSATKGIESDSLERMSQVCQEETAAVDLEAHFAVLSGPTFADELVAGTPTAAVVATEEESLAAELRNRLSVRNLRLYSSTDVVGVEIGGTAKNVIAIAAGVTAGLGFGHNTLAALITRGLHEIARLGQACGGRPRTFSGLAGLGDLVLTCTGGQSRNRRTGEALAAGKSLEEIQHQTRMVAEGVLNSRSLDTLAHRMGVEMPITEQMEKVLYENKPPRQAVEELMQRDLKAEAEL